MIAHDLSSARRAIARRGAIANVLTQKLKRRGRDGHDLSILPEAESGQNMDRLAGADFCGPWLSQHTRLPARRNTDGRIAR